MFKPNNALNAVKGAILPSIKAESNATFKEVQAAFGQTPANDKPNTPNSTSPDPTAQADQQRIANLKLYLNRLKADQDRFRQAQQQELQQKKQTEQQNIEEKQRIKQYQFEQKRKTALVGGLGGVEDKKRHHERVGKRF